MGAFLKVKLLMTENEIKKHNAHAVDKNVNRHMCKSNNCKNRAHGMQKHVSSMSSHYVLIHIHAVCKYSLPGPLS